MALRTVSEALAMAACQLLEIESGELMAEYRPALTPAGKSGLEAEIFLYDTLPGGAGFASQFAERGLELFQRAHHLLTSCPENCDASCYRCLRSFKNKFEHRLLDRHVGVELLEYLLTGKHSGFNKQRLGSSTSLLQNDLLRHAEGTATFLANVDVTYAGAKIAMAPILAEYQGKKFIIALSAPLSDGHPADSQIAELQHNTTEYQVIVQNELIVRSNLPNATRTVLHQVTV